MIDLDNSKLSTQNNWEEYWEINANSRFTKISWAKKRICDLLVKYITGKDTLVLDAGCGSGFFSAFFISMGCLTYSLDYSIQALDIAKRLTNDKSIEYIQANLLDENLPTRYFNKFDVIFTDGLFEHFDTDRQKRILKHLILMKKPKGKIVTFVPNKYSLWELIRPIFMPHIKEMPFTLAQLDILHSGEGLICLEKGGINTFPIRYSGDRFWGNSFGMLLYYIGG